MSEVHAQQRALDTLAQILAEQSVDPRLPLMRWTIHAGPGSGLLAEPHASLDADREAAVAAWTAHLELQVEADRDICGTSRLVANGIRGSVNIVITALLTEE
ncbi:hypothetical protein J5X84_39480 [Streptosporangiaceae bacterium NEAU-GS5]|nr:hypothetical protein [Streptosporangiaceae bacterium NEAU-GS5]